MNLGGMGTTMGELLVLPIYANLPTDMQVGLGLGGWGGFMVFSMTSDGFNSLMAVISINPQKSLKKNNQ